MTAALVNSCLVGLLIVAQMLSNPFGTDLQDLELTDYLETLCCGNASELASAYDFSSPTEQETKYLGRCNELAECRNFKTTVTPDVLTEKSEKPAIPRGSLTVVKRISHSANKPDQLSSIRVMREETARGVPRLGTRHSTWKDSRTERAREGCLHVI